ncbi:MAG: hypothetical protein J6F30_11785 [Cellulosilyticum sp.]|nr:hypothetical protein [Cellulosilyticum sp.]
MRIKRFIIGTVILLMVVSTPCYAIDKGGVSQAIEGPKRMTCFVPAEGIIGNGNQVGGKIVISEKEAGNLQKGYIKIRLEGNPYITYFNEPIIEVEEGDLKVKSCGWSTEEENTFILEVTKKSKKASTVVIKDFTYSINRVAPEGIYSAIISGSAISPTFPNDEIVYQDFMKVLIKETCSFPVNQVSKEQETINGFVKFTLDSKNYEVDDIIKHMDAVPFIQEGRMMIPIRYLAEAIGIKQENIRYKDQRITINSDNQIINLSINSTKIEINGETTSMTTAPIIVNERTYVPVSEIARAFQMKVEWNKDLKTATFYK